MTRADTRVERRRRRLPGRPAPLHRRDPYLDLPSDPFQIPLGALIPQRVDNVIGAGKAIGTTHITNGAYRLHPVEWNVGEAAGHLAAFCAARGTLPRAVHASPADTAELQRELAAAGVELDWPPEIRDRR